MISVIIPAYNEENAISEVVALVHKTLLDAPDIEDFEVVVVDDGSLDNTAELAEKAGAHVISNLHNIGYGFSLKQGIMAAKHDTIVITDADGTYPIDMIPSLVKTYNEGYNLVVGARSGAHYRESFIKFPLRLIFKWLVEFTTGRQVQDVNSGLRVFSQKEIIPYFPRLSTRFSFTTSQTMAYMLAMKYVKYVPIDYMKRVGKTKVRLVRDSLAALQMIVSAVLFFNPLKLFLVICIFLSGLSAASIVYGLLGGSNALWLGFGGLLVTALIFAIGLIADVIRQYGEEVIKR